MYHVCDMDQVHLPDPMSEDITALQYENLRMREAIRAMGELKCLRKDKKELKRTRKMEFKKVQRR